MRAKQFTEAALGTNPKRPSREGSRPERGHEPQKRYVTDRKTGKQYDPEEEFDKLKNSDEFKAQMKRMSTREGVAEGSLEEYGDTAKGQKMLTKVQKRAVDRVVSKKADTDPKYAKKNSDTANRAWDRMTDKDLEEIAGAFPSPSTREKWAKDAAASNAAEAKRQAALKAKADANRLAVNTPDVERLNKVNFHGANAPKPSNASWDGDSDFLDVDGTKYNRASRMPIPGGEAPDMKLIATKEGWQVYTWTRNSLKGVVGRYFYPADKPNTIQEGKTVKQDASKPRNFVAKNAINTGAGAHKDKKKAEKQGDFKHKKQAVPMDEVMQELEAAFKEEKAPRALCISSTPDEDLGASQLASCKSQGLRARDGNKSHKLGKSKKSRVKVGGKRIKGNKYGGPLPDWS